MPAFNDPQYSLPAEVSGVWRKMSTFGELLCSMVFAVIIGFTKLLMRKRKRKDVSGETVLVTGAGSGMGRLLALRFAKLGCHLVLWDINVDGNEETARLVRNEAGAKVYTYRCDVSDRHDVYEVAKRVKKEVGDVTILINNAGVVSGRRFLETSDESVLRTFQVNTLAHFWTCKAFLPAMLEKNHGHIVSMGSLAGYGGCSNLADYCASKAAAIGFEESLRLELTMEGYTGVYSTSICPFFVDTGMFKGVYSPFFSILSPDQVVDRIIEAVLANEAEVMIPNYFFLLRLIKLLIPTSWYVKMYRGLGGADAMKNFVGRNQVMQQS